MHSCFQCFLLLGAAANGVVSPRNESFWKLLMELGGALENETVISGQYN